MLAIAEANWSSETEAQEWCKDWTRSGGCYYVPHTASARVWASYSLTPYLGEINAHTLWKDEEDGRTLAVRCTIRGRATVIIAFHANVSGGDTEQEKSYIRLKENIPIIPDADYIWMLDANNVLDEEKNSKRSDTQKTYQTHPKGVAALRECLNKNGDH